MTAADQTIVEQVNLEQEIVDRMNRDCHCVGTNVESLHSWLDADLRDRGIAEPVVTTHPHLFSQMPVFVTREHQTRMKKVIAAIESVVTLPAYQAMALKHAPKIASFTTPVRGVFMGYDFHIADEGPKLIEINTNAGGAMLTVAMARAQQACCPEVADYLSVQPSTSELENEIFAMIMGEWRLSRTNQTLTCIAIVDENPRAQYLYPEFLLFQKLVESRGVRTIIASPEELLSKNDGLWFGEQRIDMVYNRLTDFYLQSPAASALADAYLAGAVVLTPNPHTHALYANKDNLVLLSDEQALLSMGVAKNVVDILLDGVLRTEVVDASSAEQWWSNRKQWFFKPSSGFGSRGTYRGDKLTRKTFGDIMQGGYVAQAFCAPGERGQADDSALKFDVRNYVYGGKVQQIAARLYQGQTTNFRTQGGGFAPVYAIGSE